MTRIQQPGQELDLSIDAAMRVVFQCDAEELQLLKAAVKSRLGYYSDDEADRLWARLRRIKVQFCDMLSGRRWAAGHPDDFEMCRSEVQRHIRRQMTEEVRAKKEAKGAKANQQMSQKRAAVAAAECNERSPPSAKRAKISTDPPTQIPVSPLLATPAKGGNHSSVSATTIKSAMKPAASSTQVANSQVPSQALSPEVPAFNPRMTELSMTAAMNKVRDDMSAQFSKSTGECMEIMESEVKAAVAVAVKAQEALSEERMHDLSARQERVAAREKAADLREQRLDSDIFKLRSDKCLWFGKQRDYETKEKVLAEQTERLSSKEISIALREGQVERTENRSHERAQSISAREEVVYQREKDQKANKVKWEADMRKHIRTEMLEGMNRALTQLK